MQNQDPRSALTFEERKHIDDIAVRMRQLDIEERKLEHAQRNTLPSWTPVLFSALASVIVGLGAAYISGSWTLRSSQEEARNALLLQQNNARHQNELQARQQRFDFIDRSTNGQSEVVGQRRLALLLEAGILDDPDGKIRRALENGATIGSATTSQPNNAITGNAGLALIKLFTPFDRTRVEKRPGVQVIGFDHEIIEMKVRVSEAETIDFSSGTITDEQAHKLLLHDLRAVERSINENTRRRLTQVQFDALVSFVTDISIPKFETSEVLRAINSGRLKDVPNEMRQWVNIDHTHASEHMERREAEIRLWNS